MNFPYLTSPQKACKETLLPSSNGVPSGLDHRGKGYRKKKANKNSTVNSPKRGYQPAPCTPQWTPSLTFTPSRSGVRLEPEFPPGSTAARSRKSSGGATVPKPPPLPAPPP